MSDPTATMTPAQIRAAGVDALARELGPIGMVRFLQQFEPGRGDYSAARHQWLGDDDVETLASRIRARRGKARTGRGR